MNLSPFRYPGAKSRMVKLLLPLIVPHVERTNGYCEPFVGGGSMALAVAKDVPTARLWLNDLDPCVSAFWSVVACGDWPALCELVRSTRPTVQLHAEVRALEGGSDLRKAFRALFLNRTSFSGIIGSGPIGGLEQRSRWAVDCRWNPDRLCAQIEGAARLLAGRTAVSRAHFSAVLLRTADPCYLDPPYWNKGSVCYPVSMAPAEHHELADQLRRATYPWVLSYDANPEVAKLYAFADVRTVDARYSMSGANRLGWVGARELVVLPRE